MNPEFIGISIKNEDNIIHTECFSLKNIISKIKVLKVASSDKRMKHLNEILEIKSISKISLKYGCKFIFIEDLNFKNRCGGKFPPP